MTELFVKQLISGEAHLPIARNISLTFSAVFADVSINSKPFSSAYTCAS